MTNTELPDLTTWHRVPDDADIPKGVPFAFRSPHGRIEVTPKEFRDYINTVDMRQSNTVDGYQYFTPILLESPKEKLPTEVGSVIQDVMDYDGDSYRYLMLVAEDEWAGLSDDGVFYDSIGGGYLVSWSPSNDEQSEPEMDEDNHRTRIITDNESLTFLLEWSDTPRPGWYANWGENASSTACNKGHTLKYWNEELGWFIKFAEKE